MRVIESGYSTIKFRREMRKVMKVMSFKIMNQTMGCCGKSVSVESSLIVEREEECVGAWWIVIGCLMCLVKFDAYPDGIPAMHISELVALVTGDGTFLEHHVNRL